MFPLHILVVEDEIIIALELEAIIAEVAEAKCLVYGSAASAKKVLRNERVDVALLDIDVLNGKTYDVARLLQREHVPYIFVSSVPPDEVPSELRAVPFVSKPFQPAEIAQALRSALRAPTGDHFVHGAG